MRVDQVMTRQVLVLAAEMSVVEAAGCLSERRVSGAPVVSKGRLSGVVSTTDITAHRGDDARATTVADIMTPYILHVNAEDPIGVAIREMTREGVRRLVVLDDRGEIAGIVTARDIVRALGVDPFACAVHPMDRHSDPAPAIVDTDEEDECD